MVPVGDKDVSSGGHNCLNEATDYQVLKNDGFSTAAIGDGQAADPTASPAFLAKKACPVKKFRL